MFTITCPNSSCGAVCVVEDKNAGMQVSCPKCQRVFSAPGVAAPASQPPAPVAENPAPWKRHLAVAAVILLVVFAILFFGDLREGMPFIDATIKWGLNPLLWVSLVVAFLYGGHLASVRAPDRTASASSAKTRPMTQDSLATRSIGVLLYLGCIGLFIAIIVYLGKAIQANWR